MNLLRRLPSTRITSAGVLLSLSLLATTDAPLRSADEGKKPKLELSKGDRICIIGNTLAERMQHDGWLETYLQTRFPTLELTVRNLGFSADEVGGYTANPDADKRLRSAKFGSGDQWLSFCKADVIFAFFGYNESFSGAAGLDKFKSDLVSFIQHARSKQYNGKTAPRIVLFSPIAHENLKDRASPIVSPENVRDRNLPDGKENNKRLELYTKAMAEVAAANKVVFVDLFHPTRDRAYVLTRKPLTINGIHLDARGNKLIANEIDKALFAEGLKREPQALEKLRQAVVDKNLYWFERYRTVDGYNVYGGRADEPRNVPPAQRNRAAMEREMEILDIMTANRDKRVWAVAKGGDLKVDDSNTPPFANINTNKPGPEAGGSYPFLDGQEAIKKMTVGKGLKVELWASEKEFPELAKPVQMSFDTKGRMWVAVWPSYPHWRPRDPMDDKLLILEDTKGKGKADKCTVWAGGLNCPTGFEFYNGGVLLAQPPDIMFLKDTKGTGKADYRERVIHGMDSADTHHSANSFVLDPGGSMYWQEGTFHHTQVESPYGPPRKCVNAGVFRYEPRTQLFDVYVTYGFANPHGHVFDRWGQDVIIDGTSATPYHGTLFSGHLDYPAKHGRPPTVYETRGIRPCPGEEYLYSRHFPADFYGNLLVANVISFQGIRRYRIDNDGASIKGTELEPLLTSTDPNFRPSDLKVGPDGAIYILDWHNPLIGHLQHNLRDPNRDKVHGRIYRITAVDRPLLTPPKIDGEPIEKLLELLKSPEDRTRYRAKIELSARDSDQVVAAVKKWAANLDPKDANYEHSMMESLWVHQYHNVINVELLKRMLGSADFHARAAATRVLCCWRDRVTEALELLKKQAADEAPLVRLEAIRAASFFTVPEAIEVVLIAEGKPSDQYLDYVRKETKKQLDPLVSQAIKAGREIKFTTAAGARYFLRGVGTEDLLKMKRTQPVYLELLFRPGVREDFRREAMVSLAKIEGKSEVRVLLDAISSKDQQGASQDEAVVFDLVRLLTARDAKELATVRPELEKLATSAQAPLTREIGFVSLIAADGSVDKAWTLGTKSTSALKDLVNAMPFIGDLGLRTALYPKVAALLDGWPTGLEYHPGDDSKMGRYVRIELPGKNKTLTLAEVEVFSGGNNVARPGKAAQSSTDHGGEASRGIDGNTSGRFNDHGQTHTKEGETNPWWQVDLGREFPIDQIIVWNRTDDKLGKRLNGFNVVVLNKDKKVIFAKNKLPAPDVKTAVTVGKEDIERTIRRATMNALTSVRGKETETFRALARFLKDEANRADALHALLRIPTNTWPKDEAPALITVLLNFIRKIPPTERTSPVALDAMQTADNLASLLPLAEAKKVRKELGELGVRVIRLGTVVEQMRYDKERLAVKAGKPVEIIFENVDLMPHNLVITQPGALAEVGELGEMQAQDPRAVERQYVPNSKKVLVKSHLLQPRAVEKVSFIAPAKPGVYPIICTYPGHYRRMYAALYVVDDLDEYQADSEGYLTKHPLPITDELLKFNRPRTEWKFEELKASVDEMKNGRSYSTGKQMFQVATCVACHKFNGVGQDFGPDLTKLDPKQQHPVEILHDILEPSFRINEKYFQYKFNLKNGKAITGLIVEENKDVVKVVENPLLKASPLVIKVADIEDREKSKVSLMPKGLLDKLTHDEILDLVAYVFAKGAPNHPLFKGGHEHGAGHQH